MARQINHLSFLYNVLSRISPLSEKEWARAVPMLRASSFKSGENVIESGEIVGDIHFLTSGLARYYYLDSRGKEFNKSFSDAGDVLSSISSLVDNKSSPFYVQAVTQSYCLSLAYTDFLELCKGSEEWTNLRIRLLELVLIMKERREADFLMLSAASRYEKFLVQYAHIADQIPNYHIASYLGITEVALSRIRKRLGLTMVNDMKSS